MPAGEEGRPEGNAGQLRNLLQSTVLWATFLFMALALAISSSLVVYTAWLHDLKNGAFALLFAVLSAQIAINWFLWKDEASAEEDAF